MDSESERKTRRTRIDPKLVSAGWSVAPFDASRGLSDYPQCAIEEYETDNGQAITELEAAVDDLKEIAALLEASVS